MKKLGRKLAVGYYRVKFKLLSSVSKKKTAEVALDLFCTPQFRHKKILPQNFAEAEKLSFEIQGEKVLGYRWNKGGNKKVLIAHGFNSSVMNFDQYINPLIGKGYEVIAFDAPAHGRSTGKKINIVMYREMIVAINERFGPITSFIGHSMGGLAISLALEDIPHDDQVRFVLLAPATESKTAIDLFFSFIRADKRVRKEFEELIYQVEQKEVSWYSVSRAMQQIKARVRWFHDKDDDITPWKDAERIKEKNYPNIDFVITTGLGHRRIYRDHKVATSIIDFL